MKARERKSQIRRRDAPVIIYMCEQIRSKASRVFFDRASNRSVNSNRIVNDDISIVI